LPNDHYYSAQPQSAHRYATVSFVYRGHTLAFETDSGVFSRTEIDQGTEILLNTLPENVSGSVLDMGCGYGVIGTAVGANWPGCTVTMSDINERAAELSRKNALANHVQAEVLSGNGFETVCGRTFDLILQNPPISAGKAVIYQMFAEAASSLAENGEYRIVIRKQQGAPSAQTYLQTLFETVTLVERKSGYWILACEKPLCTKEEQS